MKKDLHCVVVPVCLRPSVVRDDSATVGVILKCEENGFNGYRLIAPDEPRVNELGCFFREYGVDNVRQALVWADQDIRFTFDKERNGDARAFGNLIRPRENVIRYGAPRLALADDPAAELERQYRELVVK